MVSLKSLLIWPPEQRLTALDFLVALNVGCTFYLGKELGKTTDLFEGVLQLLVGNEDLTKFKNAKAAALEVAVLLHSDALDGACDRIATRLQERGVKGISRRDLLRDAQHILQQLNQSAQSPAETSGQPVVEVIAGAPVTADICVPLGWTLNEQGIAKGEAVDVAAPILITKRHQDINEGIELATLAWYRDDEWRERIVPRSVFANARMIVDELASYGVPVNSNNAKEVVQYLADFEAENLTKLPTVKVSRQLGWQGENDEDGFLWGP